MRCICHTYYQDILLHLTKFWESCEREKKPRSGKWKINFYTQNFPGLKENRELSFQSITIRCTKIAWIILFTYTFNLSTQTAHASKVNVGIVCVCVRVRAWCDLCAQFFNSVSWVSFVILTMNFCHSSMRLILVIITNGILRNIKVDLNWHCWPITETLTHSLGQFRFHFFDLRISVISFNHTIAYTCNISLCLSLAEQTQIRSSGKYNFHSTTFQLENRHSQRIMSKTKLQHFIQTHILSEQRCAIQVTVYTNSMRKYNTIFSWYSSWILQFRQCFFCGSI